MRWNSTNSYTLLYLYLLPVTLETVIVHVTYLFYYLCWLSPCIPDRKDAEETTKGVLYRPRWQSFVHLEHIK